MTIEDKVNRIQRDFNEWVTEFKKELNEKRLETKTGKPEMGQSYWFLNDIFQTESTIYDGSKADNRRYYTGNCYLTREEAEEGLRLKLLEVDFCKLVEKVNSEPDCPVGFPAYDKGYKKFVYFYIFYIGVVNGSAVKTKKYCDRFVTYRALTESEHAPFIKYFYRVF